MHPSTSIPVTASPDPLKIEGDLTIQHTEAVQKLLLAHQNSPVLWLDLSAVTACDLAGLQLLLSARKSAAAVGAKFSLTSPSAAIATACAGLGLDVSELSTPTL